MNDLLNVVPCGILAFDDRGTIISMNKTLAAWLGYSCEELQGKSIESILSMPSRIFYQTHFFPLIKLHSKADEIFLTLMGNNKSEIPVLSNTIRQLRGENHVNVSVFMPVFQRKKYEAEILESKRAAENALKENKNIHELTKTLELKTQEIDRQYQKMLTLSENILQFSKILSHDLQEPIRKIKLFSSILMTTRSHDYSTRQISAIQKIDLAAERLRRLTHGLQEYVTIDAERTYEKVDLNIKLEIAKDQVMRDRDFSSFRLSYDHLPEMEGYPAQIEVLFYHLLDNAVQFRKPDQDLVVQVTHTLLEENIYRRTPDKYKFADHIRIVFSDNGIGFDNQYSDYVFELVKKIDPATQGLGFGLPLIKKIVDNHGGTIELHSEPGKGTRVVVVLPMQRSS
jgi:phosphoserine phosphatase RsbU/P